MNGKADVQRSAAKSAACYGNMQWNRANGQNRVKEGWHVGRGIMGAESQIRSAKRIGQAAVKQTAGSGQEARGVIGPLIRQSPTLHARVSGAGSGPATSKANQ